MKREGIRPRAVPTESDWSRGRSTNAVQNGPFLLSIRDVPSLSQVLLDLLLPGSGRRAGLFTAPRATSSRGFAVSGEGGSYCPIAIGSDADARVLAVGQDVGTREGGTLDRQTRGSCPLSRPHRLTAHLF